MTSDTNTRFVATKNDYKRQAYKRKIDLDHSESYKERLQAVAFQREEAQRQLSKQENEDEKQTKKQKITSAADDSSLSLQMTNNSDDSHLKLTDDILDKILPAGYIKVSPPDVQEDADVQLYVPPAAISAVDHELVKHTAPEFQGIVFGKADEKHFSLLLETTEEELQDSQEKKRYKVMELVLKAKNGPQQVRKKAVRWLNSHAVELGAKAIFGVVLPYLLEPDIEDTERHALIKITTRTVMRLGDQTKPYTHQIITATSPLLIDEDLTLRLEAMESITCLAKSGGLSHIISSLRPDLDHSDEFVRNLTARVFAIVSTTFGLLKVLPFVKAVINSKKSPKARHTGIKIIQHLCINLGGNNGASILPYLSLIVSTLQSGLEDELLQVRTATANTISLLADSVNPYGIDSFEPVLESVWNGMKRHRGRDLAAFLKALGSLVPLMAKNPAFEEYTNFYMRELVQVVTREFKSPDETMNKAILRTLIGLPISKVHFPKYRLQILEPFFKSFWNRRVATDSEQLSRLVVDASKELAKRFSIAEVIGMIVPLTKDANESLRLMAADAINKIALASPEAFLAFEDRLSDTLLDGVLYAFQEQRHTHPAYLASVASVCKALNNRIRPHLTLILSTVLFRMKNKDPEVRLQAADLVAAIAQILNDCSRSDPRTMQKLILYLYESLGEVYPEVLGSIIGALFSCLSSLDDEALRLLDNPSMGMLLPTLTPILKNRHEKVQENCIKLVGLIARRCPEFINAKEWIRVCFDLLDMLKSQRKRIRVASNATFGHIANAIGPQDVLVLLLNNLRVQERQLRVCTAVAIGIVSDICIPYTVLPALMNEYRMPDKNVQNGILKSLSFMFEYIDGSRTKDYLFAITPLLENALTDRDQVHRQTAATVVRHLALNCAGFCHDDHYETFIHLLNLVMPNIYEQSPHVIIRIIECLDALRIVLGNGLFFNYVWLGLFHPARKVRALFWRLYNLAYIQNCDSLVPTYPRIEELPDTTSNYNVEALDVWI